MKALSFFGLYPYLSKKRACFIFSFYFFSPQNWRMYLVLQGLITEHNATKNKQTSKKNKHNKKILIIVMNLDRIFRICMHKYHIILILNTKELRINITGNEYRNLFYSLYFLYFIIFMSLHSSENISQLVKVQTLAKLKIHYILEERDVWKAYEIRSLYIFAKGFGV